jgi:hypothetical protein
MDANDALEIAQRAYPYDLVARLAYMNVRWDTCNLEDMDAWADAIDVTRNGIKRMGRYPSITPHGAAE